MSTFAKPDNSISQVNRRMFNRSTSDFSAIMGKEQDPNGINVDMTFRPFYLNPGPSKPNNLEESHAIMQQKKTQLQESEDKKHGLVAVLSGDPFQKNHQRKTRQNKTKVENNRADLFYTAMKSKQNTKVLQDVKHTSLVFKGEEDRTFNAKFKRDLNQNFIKRQMEAKIEKRLKMKK